jgi:mono/diheme cytochrome c family protein
MLERMLIDKIENRILVGIVAFVGIMVLVGWVGIKENARMKSFEAMYHARSVERGATLFASNCATCHGNDGLGLNGRGPALNSPHLFGYNYFAQYDDQLATLESEEVALNAELDALREELVAGNVNDNRRAEILERREAITSRITGEDGIRSQVEAINAQKMALADQLLPATDNGYPLTIGADGTVDVVSSRTSQVNWGSTLYNFIFTTLVHGRPTSLSYWGGEVQMVSWSQTGGGALRNDELDDLANFILSWDKGNNWTVEDALAVRQYAIVPGLGGGGEVVGEPAGSDVAVILQTIQDQGIAGDATRGEALYTGRATTQLGARLSCAGCHAGAIAAPDTALTWDVVLTDRLNDPQLVGYSPEQYIVESIVRPSDYLADNYGASMPGNFGTTMSPQDIADVVSYLRSYSDADHSDSIIPDATGSAPAEESGE